VETESRADSASWLAFGKTRDGTRVSVIQARLEETRGEG
jgi:hypothetical protein